MEASSKLLNQCLNKELFGELFCIDLRFNVRTSYRRTKNFYNIRYSMSSALIIPEISDSVWKVSSTKMFLVIFTLCDKELLSLRNSFRFKVKKKKTLTIAYNNKACALFSSRRLREDLS